MEDERSYKNIITPEQLNRHGFYPPAPSSTFASTSGEVGRTCILFIALVFFFLTSFAILAIGDMIHFLSNLNHRPTFGTTRGSNHSTGKSPSSSILPIVALSSAATANVPPVVVGVPAPPTDQD